MSKSKLTASTPQRDRRHFGSDAYRYYFLRDDRVRLRRLFSWEHMSAVYTSELANGLGNLASRVTAMVGKYFDGVLPEADRVGRGRAGAGRRAGRGGRDAPTRRSTRLAIHEADRRGRRLRGRVNGYVTEQEPWKVAKDDVAEGRARLATILYAAAESLRAVAVLHNAVMPKTVRRAVGRARRRRALGPLADQRIAGRRPLGRSSRPG